VARHVGPSSSLFFLTSSPAATATPPPWSRYLLLHPSAQRSTFYIAHSLNHTPPFLHRPARLLASSLPCSRSGQGQTPTLLPVVPPLSLSLCNQIPSMPQCSKLVPFLASISKCCNFGGFFFLLVDQRRLDSLRRASGLVRLQLHLDLPPRFLTRGRTDLPGVLCSVSFKLTQMSTKF